MNKVRLIPVFVLTFLAIVISGNQHPLDLLLDEGYDGRIRPNSEGKAVDVQVLLKIDEIEEVDGNKEGTTVFIQITESWMDPRLNRTMADEVPLDSDIDDAIVLDDSSRVWNPDIHVVDVKDITSTRTALKVNLNGQVTKLTKARVIISCKMDFFYFPFDRHICSLKFTNLEYSIRDLKYSWKSDSNSLILRPELTKTCTFELKGFHLSESSNSGFVGNHSELDVQLFFVRKSTRGFPFFYFPAIAFATIAFVTLWMSNITFAIFLSLSSFLTMTLYWVLVQSEVPVFYQMGMLDHYYFLCINMILNTIIVHILLYGYLHPSQEVLASENNVCEQLNGKVELKSFNGVVDIDQNIVSRFDPEERIRRMGKFKQFVYFKSCKPAKYQLPIGFAIINVIYWLWILIASIPFPSGFQKL